MVERAPLGAGAALIAALVLATGCEFRANEDWNPLDDAVVETAAPVAAPAAWPSAPPQAVWLWDLDLGAPVAVAVAVTPERLFVPRGTPVPERAAVGAWEGRVVPVTAAIERPVGTVLQLLGDEPAAWTVADRTTPAVGAELRRLDLGAQGREEEPLTAIAAGAAWRTTCPRAAGGLVFAADTGAWVPAVWQPDRLGGCAELAPIDPDTW